MTAVQTYQRLAGVSSIAARDQAVEREKAMWVIEGAPRGGRMEAYARAADMMGVSPKRAESLYRAWRDAHGDIRTLADGRVARVDSGKNPWLAAYLTYCERDTNTSKGGWTAMMRDFRSGKIVAGTTWREVWREERPCEPVPSVCPFDWVPVGMTYGNLQAAAKRNPDYLFNIAINRMGRRAAQKYLLPVLRSRVGLHVGEVVQYDDVWHNTDVFGPGGKVCQMLEFAGYDVSSAFKCSSVIKPRFVRADGVRDNLKEQQFRFLFAYDHIYRGFWKGGITNVCEHGTTAIRDGVKRQISLIPGFGELIRIQESGILSEQARAGLFAGIGGGNFRMKALCEGAHNILHNATASLPGARGRDADHLHESQANLVKAAERTYALAAAIDPALVAKLELGLMTADEYVAAFQQIEAEVMNGFDHRLEGWDKRNVVEYRLSPASNEWRRADELRDMDPAGRAAIAAVLATDRERLVRCRPMSRREVWLDGQDDLIRVPEIEMPKFFDAEKDFRLLTVRENGLIGFRDEMYYGRDEMAYRAVVRTREGFVQPLEPGRRVMVCWNPMMAKKVWIVSPEDGRTLGVAPLVERAAWNDPEAIKRAMGAQGHDLASKLLPMRGRHQEESEGAVRRWSASLGRIAEAAAEKAAPVRMGAAPVDFDALAGGDGQEEPPETVRDDGAADFLAKICGV